MMVSQTNVEVYYGAWSFVQKVDYLKIPFWCFHCHELGHIRAQFRSHASTTTRVSKVWHKKAKDKSLAEGDLERFTFGKLSMGSSGLERPKELTISTKPSCALDATSHSPGKLRS
jgi:hypothetical protein